VKIVYIVANLSGGGVQRVICNLANTSIKNGLNVEVLVLSNLSNGYLHFDSQVKILGKENIKSSFGKVFNYLRKSDKGDIVITGQPHVNILVLLASIISLSKAKIFITEHNPIDVYTTLKDKYIQKIKWFLYKFSSGIICVSKSIERQIREQRPKFNKHPIGTVYNPVNPPSQLCQKKVGDLFASGPLVITCIGRLHYQKNFELAIKTVDELLKTGEDVFLKIVGDGPDKAKLESFAKSTLPKGSYAFKGFCKDVYKELSTTDLLLITSRWEGFGIVLVEALLMGVNIVSTDCTGPSEILDNGQFGLITKHDSKLLAESVRRIRKNPIDQKKMISRGVEISDPDIVLEKYLSFIYENK
jgi:glycosyltransferase involved in cell wall biosynthesis